MGVGNNNPQEMLDVSGAIKLGTTTNTNAGTIRWTGTEFQGWDGTQWITFGGGIATQLTEAQVEAFITNGSLDLFAGTTLNGNAILTTEVDGSITNEIQDLNLTGNILTITNNGSATSIDLSPYVNALIGLDGAYDQGGAGAGRVIDAVDGTVAITGEDGIMVSGTYGSGLAVGATGGIADGAGTRMFFNPNKAAFRAGTVNGTQWDDANIGDASTAMGEGTTASATNSTAMGYSTNASGIRSTAMGYNTTAPGPYSTAMGASTNASGSVSTAMGNQTTASGIASTAMGVFTNAPSFAETAVGRYNTTYTPASATAWNTADRLFVVGNGTGTGVNSSNALTITKDGTMNINDAYDMPTIGGTSGQVLTTNGTVATWTDPADDGDWTVSGNDQYSAVSGNVGIGTTTPDRQLNVESATGGQIMLSRADGATTDGEMMGEILFDNTSNTAVSSADAAAVIRGVASGTQGNSNKGGYLTFLTKDNVLSGTPATERMRINANGNVGIGTSTTAEMLDVAGNAKIGAAGQEALVGDCGFTGWAGIRNADNFTPEHYALIQNASGMTILNSAGGQSLNFRQNNIDRMVMDANGKVGIGTTAPIAPLHVEAQSNPTYGNFTYYANGSQGGPCCGGLVNGVSIHASGRVMASEFDAFSDARIKNVVGTSNSFEDLSTIMGIEITDYNMKDKAKDLKPYKKVIAQQVESVYPQAVSKITDVVPDIYAVSSIKDGYVALSTTLEIGDKVKLIFEEGAELVTVTAVDADGFSVDLQKSGDVFVYGREVNDFRTVDYEAISMLNVSATQELFKLVSGLQKANLELKSELKNYASLQSDVEKIKEMLGIDLQTSK